MGQKSYYIPKERIGYNVMGDPYGFLAGKIVRQAIKDYQNPHLCEDYEYESAKTYLFNEDTDAIHKLSRLEHHLFLLFGYDAQKLSVEYIRNRAKTKRLRESEDDL